MVVKSVIWNGKYLAKFYRIILLLDNTLQGRGAKHFFTSGGELLNIVLIWNSNDGVGWIRPAEHDNVPGTKVPGTSRDYSGSTPRVHIEIDPLRPPVMSNYTWERGWGRASI